MQQSSTPFLTQKSLFVDLNCEGREHSDWCSGVDRGFLNIMKSIIPWVALLNIKNVVCPHSPKYRTRLSVASVLSHNLVHALNFQRFIKQDTLNSSRNETWQAKMCSIEKRNFFFLFDTGDPDGGPPRHPSHKP